MIHNTFSNDNAFRHNVYDVFKRPKQRSADVGAKAKFPIKRK